MDIWGPAAKQMPQGHKYILTLVDDCTRWCNVLYLKTKDNAYPAYMQYVQYLKVQHNITVKILQSDNDTAFLSELFSKFLDAEGTKHLLTVHDMPQQNGVVERMHGTLLSMVHSNLKGSGLPLRLWGEVLRYSVFIHNRTPRAAIGFDTPYEKCHGKPYVFRDLYKFGQHVIVHNPDTSKIEPCGRPGHYLGPDTYSPGHRI